METLAGLADAADAAKKLGPFVSHYRAWIENQKAKASGLSGTRKDTANALLSRAQAIAGRIKAAILALVQSAQ